MSRKEKTSSRKTSGVVMAIGNAPAPTRLRQNPRRGHPARNRSGTLPEDSYWKGKFEYETYAPSLRASVPGFPRGIDGIPPQTKQRMLAGSGKRVVPGAVTLEFCRRHSFGTPASHTCMDGLENVESRHSPRGCRILAWDLPGKPSWRGVYTETPPQKKKSCAALTAQLAYRKPSNHQTFSTPRYSPPTHRAPFPCTSSSCRRRSRASS